MLILPNIFIGCKKHSNKEGRLMNHFNKTEYGDLVNDFDINAENPTPLSVLYKKLLKVTTPLERQGPRLIKMSDAAEMIGITTETIRKHEKSGFIEPLPKRDKPRIVNGEKIYDTLGVPQHVVDQLRDHYKCSMRHKMDGKGAIKIAIANQKGGVGKSTTTNMTAHGLARHGARVLILDQDNQGTQTNFFGYFNTDLTELLGVENTEEIDGLVELANRGVPNKESLSEIYRDYKPGYKCDINNLIVKTKWDNIDIIRTNNSLFLMELDFYNRFNRDLIKSSTKKELANTRMAYSTVLNEALEQVKHNYDVILIDSPPSLSLMTINILHAADALIVPMPPRVMDIMSTLAFHQTVDQLMTMYDKKGFLFVKNLFTMHQPNKKRTHGKIHDEMAKAFMSPKYNFKSTIRSKAEIEEAYSFFLSPYEFEKTSTDTIKMIDDYCKELCEVIIDVRGAE